MTTSHKSDRSILLGLVAFLGTFLFIPLWDVFALVYSLLVGLKARRDPDRRQEALAVAIQPLRRLLFLGVAYALALVGFGVLRGVIAQPGPFGFLITGARNYPDLATGQACCDVSTAIAPETPVSAFLAERVPNTLRLLAATSVMALLLISVLVTVALLTHRLIQRRETPGYLLHSLLRLSAFRLMVPPVTGIAMFVILFFVLRFPLFPFGGATSIVLPESGSLFMDRVRHLILPGLSLALMPSLIAAQAGVRAWVDQEERGDPGNTRWAILGMEIARTFYQQAGWILGGVLVIEILFGYPGIGNLLVNAVLEQDAPLLVASLSVFPLWLLIARARMALTDSAERAFTFDHPIGESIKQDAPAPSRPRPIDKIWLGVALLLLLFPIVSIVRGVVASPYDPRETGVGDPYEGPSAEHVLGTDYLGRDVQSRIFEAQRVTLGITLVSGLLALAVGGLWGGVSTALRRWRGVYGESLADLIRIPAEAAIVLHPALVALSFTVGRYSGGSTSVTGQSLAGVGMAIGLALSPRVAWAVEALWENAPAGRSLSWRLGGTLLVIYAAALFAAFQYGVLVSFLSFGVQTPIASLGNLLVNYQEILAGTKAVADARFYVLATSLTAPAGITALALYVLQDALTDVFAFRRKNFLPRLFS